MFKHHKSLLKLCSPLIAAQLAQIGMEVVDTIMIGHLGKSELASAALSGSAFIAVMCFFFGLLNAVGVFIARDLGAKKSYAVIAEHLYHGIALSLIVSIPAMIAIYYLPFLFQLSGQHHAIVTHCAHYLHAVLWGIPGLLLFICLREYTSAKMMPHIVMWVSFAAMPANAFLNYIFMYGHLGLPALGIAGAGYATVVIETLLPISMLIYIFSKQDLRLPLQAYHQVKLNMQDFVALIKVGAPVGTAFVLEVGLFSITAMMMGHFGTESLAAHQIAMQSASIAFMFFLGLSQAVGIRVGHCAGAGLHDELTHYTKAGLQLGTLMALVTASLFIFMPELIAQAFLDVEHQHNQQVLIYATTFLKFAAIFQFSDALQVIFNGALRGLKDTLIPMFFSLFSYWFIGLGSGLLFAYYFELHGQGLWLGLTFGLSSSAVFLWLRLRWQEKRLMA